MRDPAYCPPLGHVLDLAVWVAGIRVLLPKAKERIVSSEMLVMSVRGLQVQIATYNPQASHSALQGMRYPYGEHKKWTYFLEQPLQGFTASWSESPIRPFKDGKPRSCVYSILQDQTVDFELVICQPGATPDREFFFKCVSALRDSRRQPEAEIRRS